MIHTGTLSLVSHLKPHMRCCPFIKISNNSYIFNFVILNPSGSSVYLQSKWVLNKHCLVHVRVHQFQKLPPKIWYQDNGKIINSLSLSQHLSLHLFSEKVNTASVNWCTSLDLFCLILFVYISLTMFLILQTVCGIL